MRQFTLWVVIVMIIGFTGTSNFAQNEDTKGISAEAIAIYPEPDVKQLYADPNVLYDRTYRRVEGSTQRFDAPNGNFLSSMDEGFNFVTISQFSGDWAEVGQDKWIKTDNLTEDVALSTFAGVLLPETPLPYQMAWLLVHQYPSKQPGGEPSQENPFMYRYTKVSIYDTVEVDGWDWYQIGIDQWVHQTRVARIIPVERFDEIDTERWISIDLYEQVVIAYEGDRPVFASLISSGMADWPTNEGLFNIYLRYPRTVMSGANGQPDFYYLEEVPWVMYFDNDIALHGAYWHDGFGYRRSHGCVNLSITDAYWLYEWASSELDFSIEGDIGAAVYVYSSGEYN